MDKQTKTLLEKYGFRTVAVGGDPLHDVYEDLGARPTYVLTDTRKTLAEPKWLSDGTKNPRYDGGRGRYENPNYNQPISAKDAVQELVDAGIADESYLKGL